jgi:hypothetical protein
MTRKKVVKTKGRGHIPEYIVQLNQSLAADLFPAGKQQFLLIQRCDNGSNINPKIHARIQVLDDEQSHLSSAEVGLDFTLRYALAVTAETDLKYSETEQTDEVTITPIENPEPKQYRRGINWVMGVRPQICRVRMGVFPDLEDKICRISKSTIELIGIEPGDYICIESPDGIVRSVKAFPINEDIATKKADQKDKYPEYYKDCKSELNLNSLRKTDVDIPEIYLGEELRNDLGLSARSSNGVCHPVRIYRDSVGVLSKSAYEISIPIALVLITAALDPGLGRISTYILLAIALLVIAVGFVVRHRNYLGGTYGFQLFSGK